MKLKISLVALIIGINLFANNFPSGSWKCKNEIVKIDNYGRYIVVNNKYKAFYESGCIDSEGGDQCYTYTNKGYRYTIIWIDDDFYLLVSNKWGRNEQCY